VPLTAGLNTLTTVLTAQDGQSLTLAPTVTSDGIAPDLEITAEELEGVESLTATFTLTNHGATPLLVSAPGLWSSNVNLAPGTSLTWQPTRAPGVWPMRFVATDVNGLQTEQNFTIVVHERYAMDQAFKLMWSGFTAALTTGERERAMTFLTAGAQAKYRPVFDALAADLSQIFASFSSLQLSEISPEISEYGVVRDKNGVAYLYLIYFVRDYYGVWRLDSL
jgi:hypothetical protein